MEKNSGLNRCERSRPYHAASCRIILADVGASPRRSLQVFHRIICHGSTKKQPRYPLSKPGLGIPAETADPHGVIVFDPQLYKTITILAVESDTNVLPQILHPSTASPCLVFSEK